MKIHISLYTHPNMKGNPECGAKSNTKAYNKIGSVVFSKEEFYLIDDSLKCEKCKKSFPNP